MPDFTALEPTPQPAPAITTAALAVLAVAALYFGRDIFLPFALAVLLSFLLAPPVEWLRRLRMPRAAAVLLVVGCAVMLIGAISVLVVSQTVDIADNLPTYQKTMQAKIHSLRSGIPGSGAFNRTSEVIQALSEELSGKAEPSEAEKAGRVKPKQEPIPVQVVPPDSPLYVAQAIAGPLLGPLGTAGLVVIFIFFVLLQPSDLRDRFIRLAGGDLHRTTEALGEAAHRVSRYLLMQLVVNATYGIPLGIGLYLIGVPGAFLWALLATLLRFVPYLGPFIAALFPLTLAFVVDSGWSMLLWTLALILCIELISNNVIEPWLYGASTGLTPVAVILSAIFWTLLWGPIGLILATPFTVCLVVMGRYVPQLAFLDVLLGSEPVLTPEERLYQRLLAGNVEEALEIAESLVAEDSPEGFYERVGVPMLLLAENARRHGSTADDRKKVAQGLRAVVQELAETPLGKQSATQAGPPCLCIGGRSELDGAAAVMLAQVLENRGLAARALPASAVSHETIGGLDLEGVASVCLLYLSDTPKAYARFVCRRLKRRQPHLKIVLAAWNLDPRAGTVEQLAADAQADGGASSLNQALQAMAAATGRTQDMATPPAAKGDTETDSTTRTAQH
jgi:predicted PurR-regulated permease PerM